MAENAFSLWLLGIAWAMGPWLALCLMLALGVFAVRRVSGLARDIEKRPVEPGLHGYFGAWRNAIAHGVLAKSVLFITVCFVMFAGVLAAGIQGWVQRGVEERIAPIIEMSKHADQRTARGASPELPGAAAGAAGRGSPIAPEPAVTPGDVAAAEDDGIFEAILFVALVMAGVCVVASVWVYRALVRRAAAAEARLSATVAGRPLLVRLFHDNKNVGIIAVAAGCWVLWGCLNQVAAALLLLAPPQVRNALAVPGVMTAATIFLIVLGVSINVVMFGPFAWLTWRNVKLQLRVAAENRIARRALHAQIVLVAGLVGMSVSLYLVSSLGRLLWPSVFR